MNREHIYLSNNYQSRATLIIYYLMRVAIAVASVSFFLVGDWTSGVATALVFLLIIVPSLLRGHHKIYLPFELDFGIVAFIFGTIFLGHIADFYNIVPFWDKFLHLQSGFLLGIIGYVLIYILNEHGNVKLEMGPGFISIFAVVFSMAIGVFWEIAEFATDLAMHSNYWQQGVSVTDTMGDLIADTIGAIIFSTLGYLWMKRKLRLPFTPQFLKKII